MAGGDFRTQDNVDYLITLRDGLSERSAQTCVDQICAHARAQGSGRCQLVFDLPPARILGANLVNIAAEQVSRLACVEAIEFDREMEAKPSVGRSN